MSERQTKEEILSWMEYNLPYGGCERFYIGRQKYFLEQNDVNWILYRKTGEENTTKTVVFGTTAIRYHYIAPRMREVSVEVGRVVADNRYAALVKLFTIEELQQIYDENRGYVSSSTYHRRVYL